MSTRPKNLADECDFPGTHPIAIEIKRASGVVIKPSQPPLFKSVEDLQCRLWVRSGHRALALVHNERDDFARIGKDHIRAVADHASSDQSRGVLFGTVRTCVGL